SGLVTNSVQRGAGTMGGCPPTLRRQPDRSPYSPGHTARRFLHAFGRGVVLDHRSVAASLRGETTKPSRIVSAAALPLRRWLPALCCARCALARVASFPNRKDPSTIDRRRATMRPTTRASAAAAATTSSRAPASRGGEGQPRRAAPRPRIPQQLSW